MSPKKLLRCIDLIMLGTWSTVTWSGGFGDWFSENLIDPEDGMLDVSDYLCQCVGFLRPGSLPKSSPRN